MKKIISASIDEEIHKKAVDAQINISGLLQSALDKKLMEPIISKNEEKCAKCGNIGPKETKETLNQNIHALTWLWPDEIWICNICLTNEIKKVPIARL